MKSILQKLIRSIILFSLFFSLSSSFAQAPQKMSYQAIIRNAANTLVSNANIGMRISVLQGTATGTAVYVETQTTTTNINGLATLEIGVGTIVSGTFASIAWGTNTYFIKTETDPTGGTTYSIVGTSQFLSVPYALFAATSGSSTNNWTANGINIVNNNTGNVGIRTGATVPYSPLTLKTDGIGFTQEDTTEATKVGFYTTSTSAWLQTHSNTDLTFATNNNTTGQMLLQKGTGNLGIGMLLPTEKLEVAGKTKTTNLQVTTGAATGKVLTSDALGNATWQVAGAGNGWSLTGNSGTNAATIFIGTTDNNDIVFKRNNTLSGRITNENISLGDRTLNSVTTGTGNVAIGRVAMFTTTTADNNTAVGASTLFANTTGFANTATGYSALTTNTTGSSNTAVGVEALRSNVSGNSNVAVGIGALYNSNVSGLTAVGKHALYSNTTGILNTAFGLDALGFNTTGGYNSASGYFALRNNTTGSSNAASGYGALNHNTIGNENTADGAGALTENNGGNRNTGIGANALANNISGNENTALGYGALSGTMNSNGSTAVGFEALRLSTSNQSNTAVGARSLWSNTTGVLNVAMGSNSLASNTYGSENEIGRAHV